jgi:hypothetical protein
VSTEQPSPPTEIKPVTAPASKAADAAPKPAGCLWRAARWFLLAIVIICVVILVDALRVQLPLGTPGTPAAGEQIGVVHVHTKFSADSGGEISDVVSAARWADLSFVGITDHNQTLDAQWSGKEESAVLLVGGEEVSTADGHLLVLGVLPGWRAGVGKDTESLLKAAKKAGGARFLAHPFGTRKPWTNWKTNDFDGMEIWNGDAEWRDENPITLGMAGLIYTVNPDLALVRLVDRPAENIAKWDELLQERPVSGICSADAHADIPLAFSTSISFPAYLRIFRLMREHVLLGANASEETERDQAAIVRALKQGRSFCAVDGLAVASGFVTRVEGDGFSAGPGQSVPWAPGASLRVQIPPGSGRPMIKVYKDGVESFNVRGWRLDADLPGPGRYRTEVWLRQPGLTGGQTWTIWIIANPIYVTGGVVPALPEESATPTARPDASPAP